MNEYPADQTTGTWKRKILVEKISKKPLVLHDYRDCGSVTIGENISRADVAGETDDPINFLEHLVIRQPTQPLPELYHLICHMLPSREGFATNPDSREGAGITPLFAVGVDAKKIIALQATTRGSLMGTGQVLTVENNEYAWLPMNDRSAYRKVDDWLPQFMDLDFETAHAIASATDRGRLSDEIQRTCRHLLDITHPGDPTAPYAFRRLCEVWKEVNVNGTTELSGFRITAPATLDDWLAPFSPQSNGQRATIASVIAMMGDADKKAKAMAVLTAASADRKKAVLALLGEADEAPAPEGGAQ